MRFTARHIPLALLVWLYVYGPRGLFWTPVMLFIVVIVRVACVMYSMRTGSQPRPVVESIAPSHYCEKVRWSLQLAGIPFDDEVDVGIMFPLLGRSVPVLRFTGGLGEGWVKSEIRSSADILRYLYGKHYSNPTTELFLRPTTERVDLEQEFDKMGRYVQWWGYYHLLKDENRDLGLTALFWGKYEPATPYWQRALQRVILPVQKAMMKRGLAPKGLGEESYREAKENILKTFDRVASLLRDGRPFLCTDRREDDDEGGVDGGGDCGGVDGGGGDGGGGGLYGLSSDDDVVLLTSSNSVDSDGNPISLSRRNSSGAFPPAPNFVLSFVDITFVSLASLVVCPGNYTNGFADHCSPFVESEDRNLERLPVDMRRDVEAFRAHPAGKYALEFYRKHRANTDLLLHDNKGGWEKVE